MARGSVNMAEVGIVWSEAVMHDAEPVWASGVEVNQ